jgi:hypothetical protein
VRIKKSPYPQLRKPGKTFKLSLEVEKKTYSEQPKNQEKNHTEGYN